MSGAQNYRELSIAAKNEKRRLAELKKKQQCLKTDKPTLEVSKSNRKSFHNSASGFQMTSGSSWNRSQSTLRQNPALRCYVCDSPHHLARDCNKNKTESKGKATSQITTKATKEANKMICTGYRFSKQKRSSCVEVKVEEIPATGLIDTGSDITIIYTKTAKL